MTTDQLVHQLLEDRRTALAASWRRLAPETRPSRRLTLRRDRGSTPVGPSGTWTTSLAHRVAEQGLSRNEAAVAEVVRAARRLHVLRVATDILEDRSLPDVVRERALGRRLATLATVADAGTDADQASLDHAS